MSIPPPDVIGIGITMLGSGLALVCKDKYKRLLGWVLVVVGIGFIGYSFKDRITLTHPKEPAKKIVYTESEKEKPIIETLQVGYRADAPEIITILGNIGRKTISSSADVRLGIFDFYEDSRIRWMSAQNNSEIKAGYVSLFNFRYPISKQMFVITAIESKELDGGIFLDKAHLAYTWDYWKELKWAWWAQNVAFVDQKQNEIIHNLLNKFDNCVNAHINDRNYSMCFAGEDK